MPIDKLIIKDNGTAKEIIDFNSRIYSGLTNGYHQITLEAHYKGEQVSSSVKNIAVSSGAFEPEYQAVLDYATLNGIPTPSLEQQRRDNAFLVSYKATGGWAKDDIFFKLFGGASSSFKLICWKRVLQAQAYGVVEWKASGARGNGFDAYIDTLYVPATDGVLFQQDNGSVLFGVNELNVSGFAFGNDNIRVNRNFFNLNDASSFSDVNITTGLNQAIRTGASGKEYISENGTQAFFHPSTPLSSNSLYLFGNNEAGTAANLSDISLSIFTAGAPKIEEHSDISNLLKMATQS